MSDLAAANNLDHRFSTRTNGQHELLLFFRRGFDE